MQHIVFSSSNNASARYFGLWKDDSAIFALTYNSTWIKAGNMIVALITELNLV